jgi:hypothetical protein
LWDLRLTFKTRALFFDCCDPFVVWDVNEWSSGLSKVPGVRSANPGLLAVSLAESIVVRNLLRPVTIPVKFWLAYKGVMFLKEGKPPTEAF